MTVLIEKENLLFVSAPKVACTSIKEALFFVENGFSFNNFYANGSLRHIHDPAIYPAIPFSSIKQDIPNNFLKVTMVRDPIKRFLSAYSNRVVHYKELSSEMIGKSAAERGVPVDPDLHQFIENLSVYREISRSINLHTAPLVYFLGVDSSYYSHIFDISQIVDFDKAISDHIKRPYQTPHLQTGGPKINQDELRDNEKDKIINMYDKDYEVYGQFIRN